jgi:hypothetical protein
MIMINSAVLEVLMGLVEYTVSYKNRLYRFANQQQMNIFMQYVTICHCSLFSFTHFLFVFSCIVPFY